MKHEINPFLIIWLAFYYSSAVLDWAYLEAAHTAFEDSFPILY